MSVFGESLGENRNSLEADCSYRFGGWSKASSVKMNWILLFHLIRFSQLGLVSLCLRMKGWRGKKETDNRRQQVFHTLQQIDKSFQRPQKLCRFNQITGQNSECSLSRNVPIQKFGCTIIVSTRRWVDIMFCLSSVFVHFFLFMSKISLCWFHLHVHALNARDIKVQRSTISTKIALLFRRSHSYFFHLFSSKINLFLIGIFTNQ